MSDVSVAGTAALAALVALLADRVPASALASCAALAAGGVVLASLRDGRLRSPRGVVFAVCLALLVVSGVGLRARQDLAGLTRELPREVQGVAELGSDPERSDFGSQVELTVDGRRYLASTQRDLEAGILSLRVGDRVEVSGPVRRFRGARQGWVRSRHLAGRLSLQTVRPAEGTRAWYGAANGVHRLLERGAASLSEEHRALYLGLVVGDDREQDEFTAFRFRASGLTHLLAVSGQNLAFVLVALSPLTQRVTFRWRWILGATAIVAFVLVTRAEPSVMRAAVMAVLGLTAAAVGRTASGIRVLGLAVILLLLGDPMLVESVGFRLSVAATIGLVVLTRPIGRRLPGPQWLARPLAVTLAAQMGAVPVMAMTFGAVSVLAVPANLAAEPAAGAVMTLGMTSGLLAGAVREELAIVIQSPVRLAVWWVDAVAAIISDLSAQPVGVVGWGVTLAMGLMAASLWRRRGRQALGRACLVTLLPWLLVTRPASPDPQWVTELELRNTRSDRSRGASVVDVCGVWVVALGEQRMNERAAVEVLEGLWAHGLRRVGAVHSAVADGAAPQLARWLHAELLVGGTPPRARGSPCAG